MNLSTSLYVHNLPPTTKKGITLTHKNYSSIIQIQSQKFLKLQHNPFQVNIIINSRKNPLNFSVIYGKDDNLASTTQFNDKKRYKNVRLKVPDRIATYKKQNIWDNRHINRFLSGEKDNMMWSSQVRNINMQSKKQINKHSIDLKQKPSLQISEKQEDKNFRIALVNIENIKIEVNKKRKDELKNKFI